MMLIEETSVPDAALPVDAFKAHMRLGSGFGQDDVQDEVLGGFLHAALAAIEARTGKALIARDFRWTVFEWRGVGAQVLPIAPVLVVSRVVQVAGDGSERDVDPTTYRLEQDTHRPRLRARTSCLPAIDPQGHLVVEMTAGMAATWAELPSDLRQAVFLLAAHYYEFRTETALSDGCMPFGVTSLIGRYRAMRIGGGA